MLNGLIILGKEFDSFTLDCIILNWEDCMFCGPSKLRRVVSWCPLPISFFKFNVDGVTKGNPGLAGIDDVLRNSKRETLFMFFKNVGVINLMRRRCLWFWKPYAFLLISFEEGLVWLLRVTPLILLIGFIWWKVLGGSTISLLWLKLYLHHFSCPFRKWGGRLMAWPIL